MAKLRSFVGANLPLLAIGALVICALAALALFGRGSNDAPSRAQTNMAAEDSAATAPAPEAAEDLDELPATAKSEAVAWSQLDPSSAQAKNGAIPIASDKLGAAKPFVFRGSATDRARAEDCLSLVAIAEAGGGAADQRAVMQVVLNRVRHPAFANTVCGVVFEGSQRSTGCQFTFTCDGSLTRSYPAYLMNPARARAKEALGGYVDKTVGNATHYHADYVYPWWSPRLDKVAKVGPHLFLKWRGYWGTPQALSARYGGNEPDPAALRRLAAAVERPSMDEALLTEEGEAVKTVASVDEDAQAGNGPNSPAPGIHFVLVSQADNPAELVVRARRLCPGDRYCQVMGWSERSAIPDKLPLSDAARAALRFSFLPASDGSKEAVFFDCSLWDEPASGRCLPKART
ncbi:cell wall hydrolase [Erythrobacter litoralis]|nr:cell wall hydrolase [Erythrobacter litoralis]